MLRNAKFVAFFVTAYLIIYQILIGTGASLSLVAPLFFLSPFLLIWLVYVVLKFEKFQGKVLEEDEEWGYQDRDRETL